MSITGLAIAGGIGYLIGSERRRSLRYSTSPGYLVWTVKETMGDIIKRKLYMKYLGTEDPYAREKMRMRNGYYNTAEVKDSYKGF